MSTVIEESVNAEALAKQQREDHKLEKRLCRLVGKAIVDYNMIEAGDRVMVCLSGGKDSYAMLDILLSLQKSAPVQFELVEPRFQRLHRDVAVLVLRAFTLTLHDRVAGKVGQAYGRVCSIDVLTTCTTRTIGVYAHFRHVEIDFDIVIYFG